MSASPHPPDVDAVGRDRPSDAAIRALVLRLSRPHPSGGKVIERAAVLASGAHVGDVMRWIAAHAGQPETAPSTGAQRGLHGSRVEAARTPQRYVLPADALD
jgi:hypothetical protein